MTPIVSFLQDGHLPQDANEARKIRKKVARFTILNDVLYKRGFSMPYLKCVDDDDEASTFWRKSIKGFMGTMPALDP